jgi:hypothetical protein
VPRPRAEVPRIHQVLIRLTADEYETLAAVAGLERTTPNQFLYSQVADLMRRLRTDPLVEQQIALTAQYQAREAEVIAMPPRLPLQPGGASRRLGEDGR